MFENFRVSQFMRNQLFLDTFHTPNAAIIRTNAPVHRPIVAIAV